MRQSKKEKCDTGPRRVGIWIRVSTDDQARGESPEIHEKRARLYAEAHGWDIHEVFHLEGVSGKTIMGHPETQRMLQLVRTGRISALIFSKLARLARNTKELIEFAEEFERHGADLISLDESIDTGSPAGRFFFTVIGAMAQWEREEIAARVAAAVPIRAKLGKPIGGQAPFGYRWMGKRLVPDPNEAPIRVLIYQLYAEHKRRRTVARVLNERGYRTRNGSKWSDTTITRLLRDSTAKGLHRANYTRTDDRRRSWELKPESEWVFNEVEPVVGKELWEACNHLLDEQHAPRKRRGRKPVHVFAGIVECTCGRKMYVWSNSPKYVCTKCKNRIAVTDLEAIYREQLTQYLVTPSEIEAHFAAADEAMSEKGRLVRLAEEELRKIEAEDDRLYRLYVREKLSEDEFGRRHQPLAGRRMQLEEELPRLQAELDVLRISNISKTEAITEAESLAKHWPAMSKEDQRQIIEAITERIVIKEAEVEIDLLYRPPFGNRNNFATQPCRCGFMSDPAQACARAPKCGGDYQARLSGPLLDRIDIHVEVNAVSAADLSLPPPAEGSSQVASRVARARDIQRLRYENEAVRTNAEAEGELLDRVATPDKPGADLLADAADAMKLTARGYHRVLRVARTIADLAASQSVKRAHVAEALSYRRIAQVHA